MARAYDMKNGELKWVYSYSDSAFQSGSPIAASAEVSVVAAQGNIYMLNTTTGELIHDSYFPGISDGNDAREAFVAIDAGARRAYVAGGTSLAAYSFIGTRIFIQESQDYKYVASGVVDGNGQLYLACYQTTSTSKLIELPPTGIPLSQVSLPLPITDIILPGGLQWL
jgi:outer membrane protein assembly factor BamB